MPVSHDAIKAALADFLKPEQIPSLKETGGKVLITIAAPVPTAEKPAYAERVKRKVRAVEGVKEVFVSFAEPARPAGAEAGMPPQPEPMKNIKRIVAVGAGKGGVGKSTVAVNLAIALSRKKLRVGLLDADVYGPSAALMTGTADHKAKGDAQQRVVPAKSHGISVISVAFLLPEDQTAIIWRGPLVGKMVQQLLTQVAWGELDYLIVDLPPGTGDAVLSLSQTVPLNGAVVVTTPQDVALLDVLKAVEMFQSVQVPVAGVIENMAGFTCPKCGAVTEIFLSGAGQKAAERFDLPLLGRLPLDPAVPPGGDSGEPILVQDPESPTSQEFTKIAEKLDAQLAKFEKGDQTARVDLQWS